MRDRPLCEWLGLFTLRAPLATVKPAAAREASQNAQFPRTIPARAPRLWTTLRLGEAGARNTVAPYARVPARSVHTAESGVHNLWTKLLITCGGREG